MPRHALSCGPPGPDSAAGCRRRPAGSPGPQKYHVRLVVLELQAGRNRGDGHAAHRVDRGRRGGHGRRVRRRRRWPLAGVDRHQFGHDRHGHLHRRTGTDVETRRRVHLGAELIGDVQFGHDRRTAPRAGHESDVRHTHPQRRLEDPLLIAAVRGDHNRRRVRRQLRFRFRGEVDRVPGGFGHGGERPGDRRRAVDMQEGRRQDGLQEDVERATGQAGVADDDEALRRFRGRGARLVRRCDSQQGRLAVVEQTKALDPDGRLGAHAADETLDRAVGQHDRAVARLRRRRPLSPDDRGEDKRGALGAQPVRPRQQVCAHLRFESGEC